ncbi:hypothetical protein GCM10010218_35880 [Streptomyces mashuensis]|uniref:Uncharacterized protein n=1 Tax=Streptomyces mashuensis TaxID=33904 RepID=A0A919B584_9ACTN|nr:hypothetical protein [Streptomyces mashuensis]GHF51159.1 hypothetical protein GCM10010218_35880 [Streptomyces mashuensis]
MSGRFVRCCAAALLAGGALAVPVPAAGAGAPPAAPPPGQPVSALLSRLRTLYREAEEATEDYRATGERLRSQEDRAEHLAEDAARARLALAAGREAAGAVAREQYRGACRPLPVGVEFLLSRDPRGALDRGHTLDRAARRRAATVRRLEQAERRAATLAARARGALNTRQTLAATRRRQRDTARERLGEVERVLASLTDAQLTAWRRLERGGRA